MISSRPSPSRSAVAAAVEGSTIATIASGSTSAMNACTNTRRSTTTGTTTSRRNSATSSNSAAFLAVGRLSPQSPFRSIKSSTTVHNNVARRRSSMTGTTKQRSKHSSVCTNSEGDDPTVSTSGESQSECQLPPAFRCIIEASSSHSTHSYSSSNNNQRLLKRESAPASLPPPPTSKSHHVSSSSYLASKFTANSTAAGIGASTSNTSNTTHHNKRSSAPTFPSSSFVSPKTSKRNVISSYNRSNSSLVGLSPLALSPTPDKYIDKYIDKYTDKHTDKYTDKYNHSIARTHLSESSSLLLRSPKSSWPPIAASNLPEPRKAYYPQNEAGVTIPTLFQPNNDIRNSITAPPTIPVRNNSTATHNSFCSTTSFADDTEATSNNIAIRLPQGQKLPPGSAMMYAKKRTNYRFRYDGPSLLALEEMSAGHLLPVLEGSGHERFKSCCDNDTAPPGVPRRHMSTNILTVGSSATTTTTTTTTTHRAIVVDRMPGIPDRSVSDSRKYDEFSEYSSIEDDEASIISDQFSDSDCTISTDESSAPPVRRRRHQLYGTNRPDVWVTPINLLASSAGNNNSNDNNIAANAVNNIDRTDPKNIKHTPISPTTTTTPTTSNTNYVPSTKSDDKRNHHHTSSEESSVDSNIRRKWKMKRVWNDDGIDIHEKEVIADGTQELYQKLRHLFGVPNNDNERTTTADTTNDPQRPTIVASQEEVEEEIRPWRVTKIIDVVGQSSGGHEEREETMTDEEIVIHMEHMATEPLSYIETQHSDFLNSSDDDSDFESDDDDDEYYVREYSKHKIQGFDRPPEWLSKDEHGKLGTERTWKVKKKESKNTTEKMKGRKSSTKKSKRTPAAVAGGKDGSSSVSEGRGEEIAQLKGGSSKGKKSRKGASNASNRSDISSKTKKESTSSKAFTSPRSRKKKSVTAKTAEAGQEKLVSPRSKRAGSLRNSRHKKIPMQDSDNETASSTWNDSDEDAIADSFKSSQKVRQKLPLSLPKTMPLSEEEDEDENNDDNSNVSDKLNADAGMALPTQSNHGSVNSSDYKKGKTTVLTPFIVAERQPKNEHTSATKMWWE